MPTDVTLFLCSGVLFVAIVYGIAYFVHGPTGTPLAAAPETLSVVEVRGAIKNVFQDLLDRAKAGDRDILLLSHSMPLNKIQVAAQALSRLDEDQAKLLEKEAEVLKTLLEEPQK